MTATLVLKPGKDKSLRRRHPWVFPTAVARIDGTPSTGDTVVVRSAEGDWLAWAAYSEQSVYRARVWSFDAADRIDDAWMESRGRAAVERRAALADAGDALRLVFGESDRLPGLVVDRYGQQLVTQFHGAGVDRWREALVAALVESTGCSDVFDRSDASARQREGLPPLAGVLAGDQPPALIEVREHGLEFLVDVRRGHKTGLYLDQRDNRRLACLLAQRFHHAHGRAPRCLNCFCYTGGFTISLLAAGAAKVHSIDSSADALRIAARQLSLNGLEHCNATWEEADVFEALRALRGAEFDLIVLDPPKFASSQHHLERASRAYKDINLNALRLLAPGGYLMTFSCSGAVGADLFQKIVAGAVIDAGIDVWLLQRLGAGADHPLLMTAPESEYLWKAVAAAGLLTPASVRLTESIRRFH
jgi:23S rRNA (cytosine1962-C5)-methyltransferase